MSNIFIMINSYLKSINMELRHLRYFIAVAEELHFGRAALRLHMAQPPLSQQIRQLEDELGVPLFHRTKRRVQLTSAGQVFLDEARRTLTQAAQAVRAAQRAHRGEIGRLSVGFVNPAMVEILPNILRLFRERFPEVDLTLHEMSTTPQLQALRERRIDVGFLRPPLDDNTLIWEIIHREPLVVMLPQHHALTSKRRIALRLLAQEPFILPPYSQAYGLRGQVVRMCQSAGFVPNVTQEAGSTVTAGLVAAGLGISIVPVSIQTLREHGVVYRAIQDNTVMRELAVAWRSDNVSTVLQAFLQMVKEKHPKN